MRPPSHEDSRRDFIRGSSLLLAGAVPAALATAASSSPGRTTRQQFRIGLVGCGFRGTAAAAQALSTATADVRLVAVADLFEDRLQQACRSLKSKCPENFAVTPEHRFVGFDAYRRLLDTDVDVVVLATAPGFRPLHFEAAVEQGKHVFAEKPVACDSPGVRRFLTANEYAQERRLAVFVGLQRRHIDSYRQTIQQLQQGAIGDLTFARTYCKRPAPRVQPRRKGQSELEYQLRNWQLFNWAGGDTLVEQQVQNLDVINWLVGEHPIEAQGVGGWHSNADGGGHDSSLPDHHSIEFCYCSGLRLFSVTQRSTGNSTDVSEWVHGTDGWCDISAGKIYGPDSQLKWKADGSREGYQAAFDRLFTALSTGDTPNEGHYAAESTLTAIMGRMASSSGTRVRWSDCFASNQQLAEFEAFRAMTDSPPTA